MAGRPKKESPFAVIQENHDKATEGKVQILQSSLQWNYQKLVGNGMSGVQMNALFENV